MDRTHVALLFAALLPFSAQAGAREDVGRDLDEARQEVRADMARERARLDGGNLSLDGLHFGSEDQDRARRANLPKGEITRDGDLLIEGKAVAIDAVQRRRCWITAPRSSPSPRSASTPANARRCSRSTPPTCRCSA